MTFEEVIDSFRATYPDYGDVTKPQHGHCQSAARKFSLYCVNAGYLKGFVPWAEPHVYEFYTDQPENPAPEIYRNGSRVHGIASLPDCYVDWTARQYDPTLPYPLILWKKDLKRRKDDR